ADRATIAPDLLVHTYEVVGVGWPDLLDGDLLRRRRHVERRHAVEHVVESALVEAVPRQERWQIRLHPEGRDRVRAEIEQRIDSVLAVEGQDRRDVRAIIHCNANDAIIDLRRYLAAHQRRRLAELADRDPKRVA